MGKFALLLLLAVAAGLVHGFDHCESASDCCLYAHNCLAYFGSSIDPDGAWIHEFDSSESPVDSDFCNDNLVPQCPPAYDFIDGSCVAHDFSLASESFRPSIVAPIVSLQDCLTRSTQAITGDNVKSSGATSFDSSYCILPFMDAMRVCLLHLGIR
eukprot:CAMPEP_0119120192 /NCGR_PEP_ID=MMETSP1310-20130426/1343_1 /TAXON_ID=464262 /ORGANISM="Genus nov. species nov., Strain RCC2339" /LENGTH=155 /DNA_ID=CAMNT_0007109659 /DNA_START=241 /DNA_END=708 /DNA_ORIENTATION=+